MKHKIYYEGKVQSLGLITEKGYATIGVIEPGSYTFSTETDEQVEVITGVLSVKLPNQNWKTITPGNRYEVGANCSFDVKTQKAVSYICFYGKNQHNQNLEK